MRPPFIDEDDLPGRAIVQLGFSQCYNAQLRHLFKNTYKLNMKKLQIHLEHQRMLVSLCTTSQLLDLLYDYAA
jgi:hypothetical protein